MLSEFFGAAIWGVLGKVLAAVCVVLVLTLSYQHVKINNLQKQVNELTKELNVCRDDARWLLESNQALEEQYLYLEKHFSNIRDLCKKLLSGGEITDERIKNLFKDPPK